MRKAMKNRIAAVAAVAALGGCDNLLEVNNPNNLVEESIRQEAAANAVVNGALSLAADAIANMWQVYLVPTDEFYWIGSRDAWGSLDRGFLSDPNNEFSDAAFPTLGQARWMSDEAIEILEEHVANNPGSGAFKTDLGRANLYSGIIYMTIGEVQEDFAFSDKTEDGAPVGPSNMFMVLDDAIERFDRAVTLFGEVGQADRVLQARALRARAKHSRAVWDKLKPTPDTADPLVAAGTDDAAFVVANAPPDWAFGFTYSASTLENDFADFVNDRKENQIDLSLVTVDAANDVSGIALHDPIDGVEDPVVTAKVRRWKTGNVTDKGSVYTPLDVVSTRMMYVILAEAALAQGRDADFAMYINDLRGLDGLTPWSGQIPARAILEHERRVNTLFMGQRLADMYRFGLTDRKWQPNGDAVSRPGTLLPITNIELRANCHMNGSGCPG